MGKDESRDVCAGAKAVRMDGAMNATEGGAGPKSKENKARDTVGSEEFKEEADAAKNTGGVEANDAVDDGEGFLGERGALRRTMMRTRGSRIMCR